MIVPEKENFAKDLEKKRPWWSALTDPVILLFIIMAVVGLLTYLIPAGQYESVVKNGQKVIDPNSFHFIQAIPTSFLGLFSAIPLGLQNAAPLIFMIFLIGGAIKIFETSGAIGGAVAAFARRYGEEKSSWVLVLITTFFMSLGAFPGMLEAAIPFAPLVVGIALSMKYDVIVGMSTAVMGIAMGFAAGPTNPWNTGIAQQMAGLPLFSGIGFRLGLLFVLAITVNAWILVYAKKVKANPQKSIVYGIVDNSQFNIVNLQDMPFGRREQLVLLTFIATIVTVVYGTLKLSWGMTEMSAVYIIGAIVGGIIAGYNAQKITSVMIEGAKSIFIGALAIGLARGISVIMQNTKIIDTIVHYSAMPLQGASPFISACLMFIMQALLTFFIPSGSGLAMTTMPIMIPLADLLHLNKQIAILAFQFGDGFGHLAFPTVAVVIGFLAYIKIPFGKWLRYIWPFIIITFITAFSALAIAIAIDLK